MPNFCWKQQYFLRIHTSLLIYWIQRRSSLWPIVNRNGERYHLVLPHEKKRCSQRCDRLLWYSSLGRSHKIDFISELKGGRSQLITCWAFGCLSRWSPWSDHDSAPGTVRGRPSAAAAAKWSLFSCLMSTRIKTNTSQWKMFMRSFSMAAATVLVPLFFSR